MSARQGREWAAGAGAARGPAARPPWLWRAPLAPLWLRPWYDALATWGVLRLHLPLSRAWAAAEAERGPAAARHQAAEAAWRAAAFGAVAPDPVAFARLERARRRAATAWMSRRLRHPAALAGGPAAAFAIERPDTVAARHEARLADPDAAFAPPAGVTVARSHRLELTDREVRWLRFPAADGGTAWARLDSPRRHSGAPPPKGTLIALHGICIEAELWPASPDSTDLALAAGWRVLRPEAPWHGRRRLPKTYGGEPLIARGPAGFLDFLALAVPELAVWTAWARPLGPVVWAGVSLGALTAQKAAAAARTWPRESRPDGLLLVATAGDLAQAALGGSLGRGLGLRARLQAAGWREPELARWAPLLDPVTPPPLPSSRIGLLLGSADRLLPFAQGALLARRWDLPAARVTVRPQGHFSVALGLLAAPAPLRDLLAEVA